MYKNSGFFHSLKHAVDGLTFTFKNERNMRFHLCIANLICVFAYFYGLERYEWAVLFISIFLVLTSEMINTAIEQAVDASVKNFDINAKNSKDCGAGATLLCAAFAIIIGICLFADADHIRTALIRLFSTGFSGIPEFLILFGILVFNIWLLFFSCRKK